MPHAQSSKPHWSRGLGDEPLPPRARRCAGRGDGDLRRVPAGSRVTLRPGRCACAKLDRLKRLVRRGGERHRDRVADAHRAGLDHGRMTPRGARSGHPSRVTAGRSSPLRKSSIWCWVAQPVTRRDRVGASRRSVRRAVSRSTPAVRTFSRGRRAELVAVARAVRNSRWMKVDLAQVGLGRVLRRASGATVGPAWACRARRACDERRRRGDLEAVRRVLRGDDDGARGLGHVSILPCRSEVLSVARDRLKEAREVKEPRRGQASERVKLHA